MQRFKPDWIEQSEEEKTYKGQHAKRESDEVLKDKKYKRRNSDVFSDYL